ncbi:hypothetical protein LCGC14_2992910, partial [marine sediment metagenome]
MAKYHHRQASCVECEDCGHRGAANFGAYAMENARFQAGEEGWLIYGPKHTRDNRNLAPKFLCPTCLAKQDRPKRVCRTCDYGSYGERERNPSEQPCNSATGSVSVMSTRWVGDITATARPRTRMRNSTTSTVGCSANTATKTANASASSEHRARPWLHVHRTSRMYGSMRGTSGRTRSASGSAPSSTPNRKRQGARNAKARPRPSTISRARHARATPFTGTNTAPKRTEQGAAGEGRAFPFQSRAIYHEE